MNDVVTVEGIVGSDPKHITTNAGLAITNFRMASTHRYFDRTADRWEDGDTNWFTVVAFRTLAVNVRESIAKGEHVLVTGRLRIRAWETAGRNGTTVEIEASAVGHDLNWATTQATRVTRRDAISAADSGSGEEELGGVVPAIAGCPG